MKTHKKGVNDLCIHPSGKLALSVGRDCRLSMFNLVKGRCTFSVNLHKDATVLDFNLGAESYSMVVERDVFVHRAEDLRVMHSLQHGNRVLCLAQDDLIRWDCYYRVFSDGIVINRWRGVHYSSMGFTKWKDCILTRKCPQKLN